MRYIIVAVREDTNRVIVEVQLDDGRVFSKSSVIASIKTGGVWFSRDQTGQTVRVKTIMQERHISTEPNNITSDNLDNLPKF